ncbi:HHHH-motif protein [Paraburkholderia kururiensis]
MIKPVAKIFAVTALAIAVLAPAIADARSHRVCHVDHQHHRVCRWVR